ncbi:MAG TPA: DUF2341 domain-containing protein [Pirellulales bacterium]|nr:DUF2341 domain-containing protein [Pirellulales bacterium]
MLRLHKDFFDFSQAKAHGEDLRFSSGAGEPLAYQIEAWDTAAGAASIWVRIPTIKGDARQQINVHWGNANVASESNGKAVFNESNGYLSVWHMSDQVIDEVGTLTSIDTGTTATSGMIGGARFLAGQKGVFCGDKIPNYPSGASSHSSEAWFRAKKPNATILGWGNEGSGRGSKVRMQFRSPPHVHIDSDFADVNGDGQLSLGEWVHVMHTYDRDDGKVYINGRLDGVAKPLLDVKSPARMWIGGWYDHYDFVGDIDEVRVSRVARSADWVRLQYENQKTMQTLVGPLVSPGGAFSVSPSQVTVAEGGSVTLTAKAGGARKVYWVVKRDGKEAVAAVDRLSFTFDAGRVVGDTSLVVQFKAITPGGVKTREIPIAIQEQIPEPVFKLQAPTVWDGRETIEVEPRVANVNEMRANGAGKLNYQWTVIGIAVIKETAPGKLVLKRAQNSGELTVAVAIDNGGTATMHSTSVSVTEPAKDAWVERTPDKDEKPVDHQFFARDENNEGSLFYAGTLAEAADSVVLKLYADDALVGAMSRKPGDDKSYAFAVKLKPGLIKYKVEFASKSGDTETLLETVLNLVCGDAYLIDGQSNAEATDVGEQDPNFTSDWIRSYGSMAGHPEGARSKFWGNAVVRDRHGGKAQIGYWGMEIARRLVENQKMPICVINGAVGGTRIDQHQRNPADPTDVATIYGRLLWRVRQARLTHGIRGVLWHQGENDQGADGPTGGFGWESYRQHFIDLAAAWKEDFPNLNHYYVFQIWPKACAMGINGSDNKLREVQRTLPSCFSNLSVMSTLGIKPPGGCHYPVEGYAEFARLIGPLVERDQYGVRLTESITAPNLSRAYFTGDELDELALEFDQNVVWSEPLTSQFYLDGDAKQVVSGSASGNLITLKLKGPSSGLKVTYLDSAAWSPDNLLKGQNGIAALTFCDVPILPRKTAP